MTPSDLVWALEVTTPSLEARLGVAGETWTSACGLIEGRFYYIRFRDRLPSVDELVTLAYGRLIHFAIPRVRISEAKAALAASGSTDAFVQLAAEARDLFIRTAKSSARSGELGELLLFMLVEWALSAPILVSKMFLKTSKQMPVHGSDGIHLGSIDGKLVVYWGESKLYASLSSANSAIVDSIGDFIGSSESYKNEVRIIQSNLDVTGCSPEFISRIKDYFNPYKEESNSRIDCFACLAGFDSEMYGDVAHPDVPDCDVEFRERFAKSVAEIATSFAEKVKAAGLASRRFKYFLLPFPSVDAARIAFQSKLGGEA